MSIIIRIAFFVILISQLLITTRCMPASSSGQGGNQGKDNTDKKFAELYDPKTISRLKKDQSVGVQSRIIHHLDKGIRRANSLNHRYTTQALNVVGLAARQSHPDAWSHIFHKDDEVSKIVWDRTHREMSRPKRSQSSGSAMKASEKVEASAKAPVSSKLPSLKNQSHFSISGSKVKHQRSLSWPKA